jgi:uncharacterized protein (DUF1330 family)
MAGTIFPPVGFGFRVASPPAAQPQTTASAILPPLGPFSLCRWPDGTTHVPALADCESLLEPLPGRLWKTAAGTTGGQKMAFSSNGSRNAMAAYVIFDVDILDPKQYQEFMFGVKPALEAAGAKYLARGGAHKVYEGDWEPRRIVLLEFPSVAAWESFYNGATYQGLKRLRDACSSARLVSVEGLG